MSNLINGSTQLTGLLGTPVTHSLSPLMHNEAFRVQNLNYIYMCFDVSQTSLPSAVNGLKALNVKGFNCTMPLKTRILNYIDIIEASASLIGAVNTVLNENGMLHGYNTDGTGYMRFLKESGHDVIGKRIVILGAGGAASSICVQAALDGVDAIDIFVREGNSKSRGMELADKLNSKTKCKVSVNDINDITVLRSCIKNAVLLVNATSVGMFPNEKLSPITDKSILHDQLVVSDIIYNPLETRFMSLAKQAGCKTYNGIEMLIYQAVEAYKIWTGYDMPVEHITEYISNQLSAH